MEAYNNENKIVFSDIFKGIFRKLLNMPILPRFPLSFNKHGFLPNPSIETNLVCFTNDLFATMDKDKQVDCI